MAQRLVRTLCPHCKEETPFDKPEEIDAWHKCMLPFKANPPARIHKPVGCLECRQTGFLGRVGLYEMLRVTPELKRLMTDANDLALITNQACRDGMRPLRVAGALKVAAGLTTFEEVLKVAPAA
jgi:general secretion pathway protein E